MTQPIDSRRPAWHRLSPAQRREALARDLDIPLSVLEEALTHGGLSLDAADRMVEDVVGTLGLPFAVAPNFRIDGRDVLVPMVVEEASVVAAAAHAARMVREGGGFRTRVDPPITIGQIQIFCPDPEEAALRVLALREEALDLARGLDPTLVSLGGGPRDLEVRPFPAAPPEESFLVVHLLVDTRDAMGANAVNTMNEALAPFLADRVGGRIGLRILSNLADRRKVRVEARVPLEALQAPGFTPEEVRDGIVAASRFAERDPYRAATHNKGILNGTDAVVLATGNDWRAVEAGAHAYAARTGRYGPLCTWHRDGDDLQGVLEMPVQVGLVGGATRVHPGARLALRILGVTTAMELAAVAAATGMANNLTALRALATEGIQAGHMRLHRRSRDLEVP